MFVQERGNLVPLKSSHFDRDWGLSGGFGAPSRPPSGYIMRRTTGALPGILALFVFNIGVVAKLTSETVDGVDPGPIEAADAAGATRVQRAWSAVVPQILPGYLSYSLYVFELNLRASIVLGYVGAGGIGNIIRVTVTRFEWERAGAVIAAVFVIVVVLDRISIAMRRRLV
jgi:phosphonate transport system permease protein